MATFLNSFAGRRVLITGHTGFKGSWLSEWLLGAGAEIWGFSLAPNTKPALFNQLALKARLNHIQGDLREPRVVKRAVSAARPDYVFHLAAQPIVRTAQAAPADTWATNVLGTVHLLDALRGLRRPCAVVIVTTDKVYGHGSTAHMEKDLLSASDPYGASKAAVELAVASWRDTYFAVTGARNHDLPNIALATARAGNVIGGGDWAKDRLLPDCVRALSERRTIVVRNPSSVRPWQHVLDPLAGYLTLASELRKATVAGKGERLAQLSGAFNFGPAAVDHRTVGELVETVVGLWPGKWKHRRDKRAPAENPDLRLNALKAQRFLGWRPKWTFDESVTKTLSWYQGATTQERSIALTQRQLAEYMSLPR